MIKHSSHKRIALGQRTLHLTGALIASFAMALPAQGQTAPTTSSSAEESTSAVEINTVTLTASADASAEGLAPAFAGGQARDWGYWGIGTYATRPSIRLPIRKN